MTKSRIIFLSITVFLTVALLYVLVKVPLGNDIVYFKNSKCQYSSAEKALTHRLPISDFINSDSTIDCNTFFNQISFCHPVGFSQDFDSLSIFLGDDRRAEDLLTKILTTDLHENNKNDFLGFQPNELMKYIVFSERVSCQNTDRRYKYFYQGVQYYWMNMVSNHLNKLVLENSDYRFNPMFRVLVSRCAQNDYHVSLEFTALEKVVSYFIDGKYSYVWGRIWLRTSLGQKTMIFFAFTITLLSYIISLSLLYRFVKFKIKKS